MITAREPSGSMPAWKSRSTLHYITLHYITLRQARLEERGRDAQWAERADVDLLELLGEVQVASREKEGETRRDFRRRWLIVHWFADIVSPAHGNHDTTSLTGRACKNTAHMCHRPPTTVSAGP